MNKVNNKKKLIMLYKYYLKNVNYKSYFMKYLTSN